MMISTSEIKVSCVVEAKYTELAVTVLPTPSVWGRNPECLFRGTEVGCPGGSDALPVLLRVLPFPCPATGYGDTLRQDVPFTHPLGTPRVGKYGDRGPGRSSGGGSIFCRRGRRLITYLKSPGMPEGHSRLRSPSGDFRRRPAGDLPQEK